ncbi:pyruvate kinase [Acidianus brierleyi]|uniref:Pyruvate kinase n=1 Tax=Acidianus brierleyi TaxID=41673 RepID=A0A2U9IBM4_9CREN|nr:pyruvate kinase [Acidianus brierleyi]AWR93410.1 pyruvate kinase [Acidianus brierleyi]
MRKTKIVATLGPSSENKVKELSKYVNIFRLNFAHGDENSHKKYFDLIKDYAKDASILVDLPGPKIRIGDINGKLDLKSGDKIVFSEKEGIPVEDPLFYKAVKEGIYILLADGNIKVKIDKVDSDKVEATVIEGGILTSRKGINIPDIKLDSGITDNDLKLLNEALRLGADFIGLSFVISYKDVIKIKNMVKDKVWIISKIEKKSAVNDLHNIIRESDGIMVARGDLGVEIGLENLPFVQKKIIKLSKLNGKPVILATQVLESMVNSPMPTRAEVIDISNSISQGVDAIMLSDETAAGNFPIEAVKYLDNIITAVEKRVKTVRPPPKSSSDDAIAIAAVNVAEVSKSKIIAVHSRSGISAIRISRLRPKVPIIALCPNENIVKKLKLCWGVYPFYVREVRSLDEITQLVEEYSKDYVKEGESIVIAGGDPKLEEGRTNFIKLHRA